MVSLGRLGQRLDEDTAQLVRAGAREQVVGRRSRDGRLVLSGAVRIGPPARDGRLAAGERILGALQALRVDRDRSRKVAADENRPEDVRLKPP